MWTENHWQRSFTTHKLHGLCVIMWDNQEQNLWEHLTDVSCPCSTASSTWSYHIWHILWSTMLFWLIPALSQDFPEDTVSHLASFGICRPPTTLVPPIPSTLLCHWWVTMLVACPSGHVQCSIPVLLSNLKSPSPSPSQQSALRHPGIGMEFLVKGSVHIDFGLWIGFWIWVVTLLLWTTCLGQSQLRISLR